jgi:plasmid stabilization system protein ParE
MRTVVAPRALDDLAATTSYIARDKPAAAARLVDRVFEVIDLLAEGGLDGPLSTLHSGLEVRSWPVPPLRIFYRREADALHVLRIYHQSRRPLES